MGAERGNIAFCTSHAQAGLLSYLYVVCCQFLLGYRFGNLTFPYFFLLIE